MHPTSDCVVSLALTLPLSQSLCLLLHMLIVNLSAWEECLMLSTHRTKLGRMHVMHF